MRLEVLDGRREHLAQHIRRGSAGALQRRFGHPHPRRLQRRLGPRGGDRRLLKPSVRVIEPSEVHGPHREGARHADAPLQAEGDLVVEGREQVTVAVFDEPMIVQQVSHLGRGERRTEAEEARGGRQGRERLLVQAAPGLLDVAGQRRHEDAVARGQRSGHGAPVPERGPRPLRVAAVGARRRQVGVADGARVEVVRTAVALDGQVRPSLGVLCAPLGQADGGPAAGGQPVQVPLVRRGRRRESALSGGVGGAEAALEQVHQWHTDLHPHCLPRVLVPVDQQQRLPEAGPGLAEARARPGG